MELTHTLNIQKYQSTGTLDDTYEPLQNLVINNQITDFKTSQLNYDLTNYLHIDTQLSYDDSINLILNNNLDKPRIINSQFRTIGNHTFEYVTRNQKNATNIYEESTLSNTTDLFFRTSSWPTIDLKDVLEGGNLLGGTYIFYIKYCDEDYNESDIVSESGPVSIFKGKYPSTALGTILDERTSKLIQLQITNYDPAYKKFYLYFSRETCDLNGVLVTKFYKIDDCYDFSDNSIFCINGYENILEISREELFIKYNYFSNAKTQAIVQNMLFLGNVSTSQKNNQKLQELSYKIITTLRQKETSIGYVNDDYSLNWNDRMEYYDPKNIYYFLGYWPNEYYQLGICYIFDDGSTSSVFPLYGGKLTLDNVHEYKGNEQLSINSVFDDFSNTAGIFKLPNCQIINHEKKTINPLYFEFKFPENILLELKNLQVKGYFFARTKRTPTSLFQGLSVGIDSESGTPMVYIDNGLKGKGYYSESFIDNDKKQKAPLSGHFEKHLCIKDAPLDTSALLSLDPMVIPQLQSLLSWNQFTLTKEYTCKINQEFNSRKYEITSYKKSEGEDITRELVYVNEDIPSFYLNQKYFSTRAGNAETVKEFSFLWSYNSNESESENEDYPDVYNIVRGIYCPIVGSSDTLPSSNIYTVKLNISDELAWFKTLATNNYPYFSITNRFSIDTTDQNTIISAFRGDCFTNTITIRLNRNFIDPTMPTNTKILQPDTWQKNFRGISSTTVKLPEDDVTNASWTNINLGDVNAVPLGQWITFKCLSNYNLGLRAQDNRDVSLIGTFGTSPVFYPISDIDAVNKLPDSKLLNEGYSITLSRKSYNKWIPTPYENYNYNNRIAFSNVDATKMFTNGFRIFQGLAYQDIDKSFGSIVKLFPYGQNLLCVFEHGLAIVPINEKALLSTQEGLSIHLYGAGVLQEQVSVISPDYGSTWMESLIKTPEAYYGVDTSAKKIWKFNNTEGFQCISDFKIQSFLNDNLNIDCDDKFFMGATNVRTHYNNFKGDVIFTFYNENNAYSLCYNERMKMWVSRYTWMPLLSANIDNQFYSFDRSVVEKYTKLYKQTTKESGIICIDPLWRKDTKTREIIPIKFKYKGLLEKDIILKIDSLTINGEPYNAVNNIKPIITDNKISGIYYNNGIEGLFSYGGAITDNISNYTYLPIRNEVDFVWKRYNDFNNTEEITDDEILLNSYVALSNEIGDTICTSSIPVVEWDEPDENNIIDYTEHRLYPTYMLKNDDLFEFHIPESLFNFGNIELTIKAYHSSSDVEIETYIVNIDKEDFYNQPLALYKHDINSNICNWYDSQHPFEYEFVVNQPAGFHKIFNNLMIISNNVEPDSLEVEIVGDSYDFKEEFINQTGENIKYKFPIISLPNDKTYQTKLTFDKVTNEHKLLMHQDCLNIKDFGRRLGNISYIEGKWYVVLQPIYYEDKTLKTTRLRDKWAKIRIKYSGEKLAIITAIQTLMNISYV